MIPFVEDVGQDGTLKPKFDQMSADTGRFSCKTNKQPWKVRDGGCRVPFQGIPDIRQELKPDCIRLMRDCISVRDKDYWLAAVDYAGVELRLVTNLSREPKWINAFFSCSDCGKTYEMKEGEDGFPILPLQSAPVVQIRLEISIQVQRWPSMEKVQSKEMIGKS